MPVSAVQQNGFIGKRLNLLDRIDRIIINSIQRDFPVDSRPYAILAERLNNEHDLAIDENQVHLRIKRLRKEGYIRRLGAVFEARALGYKSCLCAAKVPEDKIEAAASIINASPWVTHNYLRSDKLNMWFTFSSNKDGELDKLLSSLKNEAQVEDLYIFKSKKLFKIRLDFKLSQD